MKLKKAMALLVAFCLIVPSPLAVHAEEVNTSDVKTEQPADETTDNSDSAQNLVGGPRKALTAKETRKATVKKVLRETPRH